MRDSFGDLCSGNFNTILLRINLIFNNYWENLRTMYFFVLPFFRHKKNNSMSKWEMREVLFT